MCVYCQRSSAASHRSALRPWTKCHLLDRTWVEEDSSEVVFARSGRRPHRIGGGGSSDGGLQKKKLPLRLPESPIMHPPSLLSRIPTLGCSTGEWRYKLRAFEAAGGWLDLELLCEGLSLGALLSRRAHAPMRPQILPSFLSTLLFARLAVFLTPSLEFSQRILRPARNIALNHWFRHYTVPGNASHPL